MAGKAVFTQQSPGAAATRATHTGANASTKTRRKRLIWITATAVCLAAIGGGLLFASPQLSRVAYLTQKWVFGEDAVLPPAGYTGSWQTWHNNCKRESVVTFADGQTNGEFTYWRRNGLVSLEGSFRPPDPQAADNYVYDGRLIAWHDNGQKKFESTYSKGALTGKAFVWHTNGALKQYAEYQRGTLHGRLQEWTDNGSKQSRDEIFINGRRHGICTTWEDGVRVETTYRHGLKHGRSRTFGPDGQQLSVQWFRKDKPFNAFRPGNDDVSPTATFKKPSEG